jgi:parallel beta-helix repeat protein
MEIMKAKVITGIVLTLLFIGVLTFASRIKPAKAWTGGTIRILSSGSVTPEGAPLSSSPPYILYNVTEDIISTEAYPNSSIVVERDNIIIDGAGHTLQGSGTSGPNGIRLSGRNNVTVKGLEIKDLQTGVLIADSSNVTISGNTISTNTWGIYSYDSDHNVISGNNITNNANHGVMIGNYSCHNTVSGNNITANGEVGVGVGVISDYNTISGNNITANTWEGIHFAFSNSNRVLGNDIANSQNGIVMNCSAYNVVCYNNFVNNTQQVNSDGFCSVNFWNGSYPHRGNYWSEQTHVGEWADRFSGPNQDDPTGPDGILDNDPYEIDGLNVDYLPLTHNFTPTITTVTKGQQQITVCIDSNTSISEIIVSGQRLSFTASAEGTEGYVFIIIEWPPTGMPEIRINGTAPPTTPTAYHNGTHWFIYFEFPLSTHNITIDFPTPVGGISIPVNKLSLLAPYLALIATIILAVSISVAIIKYRKK